MKRIQRQRTKGWRMPEGAVYVGRPTRWGSPFHVPGVAAGRQDGTVYVLGWDRPIRDRADSVAAFRRYADGLSRSSHFESWIAPLRGHDLACWCPLDQPCHADVLIELANRLSPSTGARELAGSVGLRMGIAGQPSSTRPPLRESPSRNTTVGPRKDSTSGTAGEPT